MYDIFFISEKKIKDADFDAIKIRYPRVIKIENVKTIQELKSRAFTKMFWVIWDDIILSDDFDLDSYKCTKWDDMYNHIFKNDKTYDGVALLPKSNEIQDIEFFQRLFKNTKEIDIVASVPKKYDIFRIDTYNDYIDALTNTQFDLFWSVPSHVAPLEDFDFNFYISHHDTFDRNFNHVFYNGKYYDGISLLSRKKEISKREINHNFIIERKEWDMVVSKTKPFDIIFISYNEPNADENYENIKLRFPRVKRIHGVKGIHQAHINAAKLSDTHMFWVVDADAVIVDDFDFNFDMPYWEKNFTFVWRSRNPVNDLEYGYGGVKLLSKELTENLNINSTDMTTSISNTFMPIDKVSNITAFNTDPFNAWKSGFRECVKLSSKIIRNQNDHETNERLKIWTTKGSDRKYGEYVIRGAIAGMNYGLENQGNVEMISKINDFDWLIHIYETQR